MGLVPFRKKINQDLIFFMSTWWEGNSLQARRWVLTRHHIYWYLDLGLSRFQNWRNKCLLAWQPELTTIGVEKLGLLTLSPTFLHHSLLGKVVGVRSLWSLKVLFTWLLLGWWVSFCPSTGDGGVGLAEIHQLQWWHKVGNMFFSKNTCDKRAGTDILLSNNQGN